MRTHHVGDQIDRATRPAPASLFAFQHPQMVDRGGFFVDLHELEFRVLDGVGDEQIAWTQVDVDRESPTTDALPDFQTGMYAPEFEVPNGELGTWTIQWRFTVSDGDDQRTAQTHFRVVDDAQPIADAYAQVEDMRDEGVPATATFTDARCVRALELASRLFDEWTSRFFEPRLIGADMNGRGSSVLQLDHPIVGISDVRFLYTSFAPSDHPIAEGHLRVFNRHIRSGLLQPDDRDDPRIEFLRVDYAHGLRRGGSELLSAAMGFPSSQQNLRIEGVFGFTDPDGTPFGTTPPLVREAVLRLAMRKVTPLWEQSNGGTALGAAGPMILEKTFDQTAAYSDRSTDQAFSADFSGDPEVDRIVRMYRHPVFLGSC